VQQKGWSLVGSLPVRQGVAFSFQSNESVRTFCSEKLKVCLGGAGAQAGSAQKRLRGHLETDLVRLVFSFWTASTMVGLTCGHLDLSFTASSNRRRVWAFGRVRSRFRTRRSLRKVSPTHHLADSAGVCPPQNSLTTPQTRPCCALSRKSSPRASSCFSRQFPSVWGHCSSGKALLASTLPLALALLIDC
jgi:hypothetical protein